MLGEDAKHQKIVFEMVKDVQKRNQEQKQDERSLIQIQELEAPLESQPNVVLDQHASTKNVKQHQTVVRSSMIHVRRNKTAVLNFVRECQVDNVNARTRIAKHQDLAK